VLLDRDASSEDWRNALVALLLKATEKLQSITPAQIEAWRATFGATFARGYAAAFQAMGDDAQ